MNSEQGVAPEQMVTLGDAATEDGSEAKRPRRSGLPMSVRRILPGTVILILVVWALRPVSDPDTFWHIATGDYLRRTWTFNGQDPWSATSTQPWRLHEWLPELVMSVMYQMGGLPAVAWLLPLATGAIAVALWLALRRRASLLVTAVVLVVAVAGMSNSLSLRPHLVTFALTVVYTGAWLSTAEDGRGRWWLIPLTWVWACSHGMWFIGPVIGLVAILGMSLDRTFSVRHALRLGLIPLGSVLVAALTPVGPELLLSPLQVHETTQFIQEWRPPSLSDGGFVAFLLLIAMTIVIWSRRGLPVPWTQVFSVGLGMALALLYIRTVPVGAAVVAPSAAFSLQSATRLRREMLTRGEVLLTMGLTVLGLLLVAVIAPTKAAVAGRGASDLDAELGSLPAGTVICNDYGLGGWLIWRHPQLRPVIDGRIEVYSLDHVERYMNFHHGELGWEEFPVRVGCNYALLSTELAPSAGLVKQEHWNVVKRGKEYVLLRPPSS